MWLRLPTCEALSTRQAVPACYFLLFSGCFSPHAALDLWNKACYNEDMGVKSWLKTVFSSEEPSAASGSKSGAAPVVEGAAAHSAPGLKTGNRKKTAYDKLRRYKRFDPQGNNLAARFVLTETIELSDISTSGACIVTTKTLRPGDNILLKIPHEKVSTPLKCTIIWESVSEEAPADVALSHGHRAGVKFTGLTTDMLVQLKDFMRLAGLPYENKLGDEFPSSPLRFRVIGNNQAKLNYPASFPVRRISLGGMLVETTCDFQPEERHPMALMLPADDRPLKFLGRVASRMPHNGAFRLGIEFMDMNAYDQGRLGMFLRTLALAN